MLCTPKTSLRFVSTDNLMNVTTVFLLNLILFHIFFKEEQVSPVLNVYLCLSNFQSPGFGMKKSAT